MSTRHNNNDGDYDHGGRPGSSGSQGGARGIPSATSDDTQGKIAAIVAAAVAEFGAKWKEEHQQEIAKLCDRITKLEEQLQTNTQHEHHAASQVHDSVPQAGENTFPADGAPAAHAQSAASRAGSTSSTVRSQIARPASESAPSMIDRMVQLGNDFGEFTDKYLGSSTD